MSNEKVRFPRGMLRTRPEGWPLATAAPAVSSTILELLDNAFAKHVNHPHVQKPVVRALAEVIGNLQKNRKWTDALLLTTLPVGHIYDHPSVATRRLAALFNLDAYQALEAEFRRQVSMTTLSANRRNQLAALSERFGLAWRLEDVLPTKNLSTSGLHMPPMEWLRQPSAFQASLDATHLNACRKLLTALDRKVTTETLLEFERGDAMANRYRYLRAAISTARHWPKDPRGGEFEQYHDKLVGCLVRADLAELKQAVLSGLSPIVLYAHLGPPMGLAPLTLLDLPTIVVANQTMPCDGLTLMSTRGESGQVSLRFIALAKRMAREQLLIAIYPDGQRGGARLPATVLGMNLSLGVGAAALARRRPSRFFFASTRVNQDHVVISFKSGPVISPAMDQHEVELLMKDFYISNYATHLADPPSEIGTPRAVRQFQGEDNS